MFGSQGLNINPKLHVVVQSADQFFSVAVFASHRQINGTFQQREGFFRRQIVFDRLNQTFRNLHIDINQAVKIGFAHFAAFGQGHALDETRQFDEVRFNIFGKQILCTFK